MISLAVMPVRLQGFQRNNSAPPVTKGYRQWRFLRVCQGWIQENSYLNRRDSRAKRGVRADSPAWSEPPKQEQYRCREAER